MTAAGFNLLEADDVRTRIPNMGWLDWLRSSDNPSAIETLLQHLSERVSELEGRQHGTLARRDSLSLLVSLHGTLAYIIYLSLLYLSLLPSHWPHLVILLAWPVLMLSLRFVVLKFYAHRLQRLGHQLESVKKKQTAEIDKLKKQTRYDETRALLEKLESPRPQQTKMNKSKMPRKSMPAAVGPGAPQQQQQTPTKGQQKQPPPQALLIDESLPSPASRGWVDRFADALLGDQDSPGSPGARGGRAATGQYALICGQCFNHNGLVLKEDLPYTRQLLCYCLSIQNTGNSSTSRIQLSQVWPLQPTQEAQRRIKAVQHA